MSSMAKTKGFDIEKYFSFDGEKISARTELYEYDDIFYLGVAYRRAATEAYPFCKGSRPYQAARKNRHDKPAKPAMDYADAFAKAVECCKGQLPFGKKPGPCNPKLSKDDWAEEKKDRGVKCSYFDVCIRETLRYFYKYKTWPSWCPDQKGYKIPKEGWQWWGHTVSMFIDGNTFYSVAEMGGGGETITYGDVHAINGGKTNIYVCLPQGSYKSDYYKVSLKWRTQVVLVPPGGCAGPFICTWTVEKGAICSIEGPPIWIWTCKGAFWGCHYAAPSLLWAPAE